MSIIKVAAVQAAPVFLDLAKSIDKAEQFIKEASKNGAKLIAFPELFLPGYPWFAWIGSQAESMQYMVKYHENSLELHSESMKKLQYIAKENNIMLVMGYSEKAGKSRYISQVIISEEGNILLNRRKLKSTHVERTIFGEGDGSDIKVIDTSLGKVGALNCWEHLQPLVKMAMYAQDEEIHIASWPSFCLFGDNAYALGAEANNAASRVYALEGSVFVLAPCAIISQEMFDIMANTDEKKFMLNPKTSKPGGGYAQIYAPDGKAMCESLKDDEEGILYADINKDMITLAKCAADPVGHYSRADALSLVINRKKLKVMQELNKEKDFEPILLENESENSNVCS